MKILFSGCSLTAGTGLTFEKNDPGLWVHLLSKNMWPDAQIGNVAQAGFSNESIFLETAHCLINNNYDIAIVAWSSIRRINFDVGFELYSTHTMLNSARDHRIVNQKTVTGKELSDLGDKLNKIRNDHWDILKLVKYINYLIYIQKSKNKKIYFINTISDWPHNFFKQIDFEKPNELDEYTKDILSTDFRDDNEIKKLYQKMHSSYDHYGSIQENHWLNLYEPLFMMKVDDASLVDKHPGYLSNKIFSDFLRNKLQNVL